MPRVNKHPFRQHTPNVLLQKPTIRNLASELWMGKLKFPSRTRVHLHTDAQIHSPLIQCFPKPLKEMYVLKIIIIHTLDFMRGHLYSACWDSQGIVGE